MPARSLVVRPLLHILSLAGHCRVFVASTRARVSSGKARGTQRPREHNSAIVFLAGQAARKRRVFAVKHTTVWCAPGRRGA